MIRSSPPVALGASRPSRDQRARAARCGGAPRSSPPKSGYSLASVLKQCGQLVTIFVTPASLSVATFCSAAAWKTYSLPIRRAGSPVHASRGPRIAKSTPAFRQQLRGRLARSARARSSNDAAQPTQYRYSGGGSPGSSTRTPSSAAQSARSDCALAPRVRRALDVAQHRLGLGREARLDHHQVAAQVDDVVDVLDRDRARLHAGAAGHAVPDRPRRCTAPGPAARARAVAAAARRAAALARTPGRAGP